ncbi:arrestin domain-containing protein 17-like [Lineus longissimus]|uniref:arrestin domain-containing protein 17-like n=1 Tax=Lineus longissimus TaxID=88925 RepID=UPI002B4EBD37
METPRRLSIQYDRQDRVYYVGEVVRGFVILDLEEECHITGIELKLFGGAEVKWTDNRGKDPHQRNDKKLNIEHNVEEIYFKRTMVLWGKGRVDNNHDEGEVLVAGRHMFPFRYHLPTDIPCSFEGVYGSVRYYGLSTLLTKCSKQNETTLSFFSVLQELNLTYETLGGVRKQQDTTIRSCCRSGRVTCTVAIPNCGFVPGQSITANILVQNKSTSKVKGASLALKQMVRYGSYDSHKSRKVLWDAQHVHVGHVSPEKCQRWEGVTLDVPCIPPSRLDCCQYIDIKYDLVFRVMVHAHALTVTLPIIIGTIPQGHHSSHNWEYKVQHPYPGAKNRCVIVDGTKLKDDPEGFMSTFKIYRPSNRGKYPELECSPGGARRFLTDSNEEEEGEEEEVVEEDEDSETNV